MRKIAVQNKSQNTMDVKANGSDDHIDRRRKNQGEH